MAGVFVLGGAPVVLAQLTAASKGPVVYGHHHLNVTSIDEHKKFWVDTLGGEVITVGPLEVVRFPNVLVFLREQAPEERPRDWPEACFAALPPSVLALDSNRLGTAMYWREQGEPTQLAAAVEALHNWQAQLQALSKRRARVSED